MQHLTYRGEGVTGPLPVCFLIPRIQGDEIKRYYLDPYRLDPDDVLVLSLYQKGKKTPVVEIKAYIEDMLVPVWKDMDVTYLMVADTDYFKVLTKATKAEANLGYVMDCVYGPWKVIYLPSHRTIFYDPEKVLAKIKQAMEALRDHAIGHYESPGTSILVEEHYPKNATQIGGMLEELLNMDCDLTCDIEGFGLKHYNAGIATISFAWSKRCGIAFAVDYEPIPHAVEAPFGRQVRNEEVRRLLKNFFLRFARNGRKMIYHNIAYDAYVLVYQLFMKDLLDTQGLLYGLSVMLPENRWHCTKLISYLATNSCAGNRLSLKDQSQEYAGNYAMGENIKDITRIELRRLLRYNLVDAVATAYVFNKHYVSMLNQQQEEIYETVFKPATVDIVQMQLTGLPVDMERVFQARLILEAECGKTEALMQAMPLVQEFTYALNETWAIKKNQELVKKRVTVSDGKEKFNPNSPQQLQGLLYGQLGLPILGYTDTKQPSTEAKVLKGLLAQMHISLEAKEFLAALIDYKSANTILTTFIPAMECAQLAPDGNHYLYGNFNLGGTISGRLSSSDPNLQNLPANSKWAKLIKECIISLDDWIFVGLDFDSLEDKISALTTKDPNKLKVYIDGYDGHSLRAFAYFGSKMTGIVDTVDSINSIQKKYKDLRQLSKAPTFALTYQGTYHTLMTNCGFPETAARAIEDRYHELYAASDKWIADKLDQACIDGYITVAFGLRLRTPLLAQVIRGNSKTPYEAQAEGRTAGNAFGQSWCLLNSRAASDFMGRVRGGIYELDIKPCAQIHDAQYYLVRNDPEVLAFVNEHLVDACTWQAHPDIAHSQVKLSGKVSIFHPNWATEISLPNGANADEIVSIVQKHLNESAEP